MSVNMNPYLSFDGNATEAMNHYQAVFGGELNLTPFSEYPGTPEEFANRVMHGQLVGTAAGFTLMGADLPPGESHSPGNNSAVILHGEDAETLRGYWAAISDGGRVDVPLEKQMWGDEYGQCVDKFGVTWMVNIAGS